MDIPVFCTGGAPVPTRDPQRRLAVLLSGGVDSSTAALLLAREGWDLIGATMRLPGAAPETERDAAEVARVLGIPHLVLDLTDVFTHHVLDAFRADYAAGRTPNPCCVCNRLVKFGAVWDCLDGYAGARHLATGHYVTVRAHGDRALLVRDPDNAKDQTYFIYGIPAARLPFFHAPLAGRTKDEVRALAREAGLPVAERPESMERCFAGGGDYRSGLGQSAADCPGPIRDTSGRVLGMHRGIRFYTVGQRRGLGVASAHPLYVVRLDVADNAVVLAPREEALRRELEAVLLAEHLREHLVAGSCLAGKIRSYTAPAPLCIAVRNGANVTVTFREPVFAPTPGQHLVLYTTDETGCAAGSGCVAGGGSIERTW